MKKYLLYTSAALAWVSLAVGCSGWEKDPTKGYENLNNSVRPRPTTETVQASMHSLYFIKTNDSLVYVQGQKHKVVFTTQLAFVDISGVRYHLEMKEGPSDLGATFKPAGANQWALEWQPAANLLNPLEGAKEFNLVIEFVLESTSSKQAKTEFANHSKETVYSLFLQKDFAQPLVEDELTYTPRANIKADETVKIQFTVAAASVNKPEDLTVRLSSGPRELASEIAQFDGLEGVRSVNPKFIQRLGQDSKRRERFQYEVTFKAKPFLEYALEEIKKQPRLKRKVESKEITEIEALFNVEAVNGYNHMASAQRNILVKVQLPEAPTPGAPR